MAWPPPVLPITRTNADAQKDTHPSDHNAANLAINDLVAWTTPRSDYIHSNPVAVTIGAGGGALGYIANTLIPAATFRRLMVIIYSGFCTTQTNYSEFTLRDVTAAPTAVKHARAGTANTTATATYSKILEAGLTARYDVTAGGTAAIAASGDARFAGMDILLLPIT